jgi:hypothetical protein
VQLALFEQEADALLTALNRDRYLDRSGRERIVPLTMIYERYPDVCSLDTYEQLLDTEVDPRIAEAMQRLVLGQYANIAIATLDEQRTFQERTLPVEWEADAVRYREARQLASTYEERTHRHALDERIREASAPLVQAQLARVQAMRRAIQDVEQYGLPTDDLGFWRHVEGVAVEDVSALAEAILEATRDLYGDALRDQLAHYGLDDGDVWEVDLEWIFRGQEYERIYPTDRLVPSVVRSLADLGLRLQDQSQIRLDVDPLPVRDTVSFCAPISVPDESIVMLADRDTGDFVDLFRFVGEAERHAHADRSQPLAYRRLGDRSVVEGYGLLLASLPGRADWLAERLEAEATRDAVRLRAFERLYGLRRAAVSHLFEVQARATEEPDALTDEYVDRYSEALLVRPFSERALDGLNDPFSGARHLRAAIFAQQLGTFLGQEYDLDWYRSERAGRFLVDRWREGQRYRVEELVQFLGFRGLDVAPLIEELRVALID